MTGRILECAACSHPTAKGTTQVFRKIVFHFCPNCWMHRRLICNRWMESVAA